MAAAVGEVDPASAAAPPSDRGFRTDIQGLRALAVLLVVAFHAGLPVPGGFAGVDVFFVISGFVITAKLLREHARTSRIRFAEFYSGRVRRILPALATMTSVVAVASVFLLSPTGPRQDTVRTGIAASLFSANFQLLASPSGYFDAPAEANALLHTWSLSVEEQFYFVFPAIVAALVVLARRRGLRTRWVGLGLGVLGAGSFALWVVLVVYNERLAFYGSFARAWEFIAGALLVFLGRRLERLGRTASTILIAVGASLILVPVIVADPTSSLPGAESVLGRRGRYLPGPLPLLPVVGTILLIAGGSSARARNRLLSSPPAQWIGNLSYSWYLWHWPLIVFAVAMAPASAWVAVAAAALSLVPAWLSYRVVEQRFRFDRTIRGRGALRLGAICTVVPIGLCLLAAPTFTALAPAPLDGLEAQAVPPHADVARSCDSDAPIAERTEACSWRVPDAIGEVVLFGDSNAGQFTEPVAEAANALGYDLTAVTNSGCPPIDATIHMVDSGDDLTACRRFYDETMTTLVQDPPSAVVLAYASDRYVRGTTGDGTRFDTRLPDAREPGDDGSRAEASRRGLASTIGTLQRAGIPVILVQTLPHLTWDPNRCSIVAELVTTNGCAGEPLPVADLDAASVTGRDLVAEVATADDVPLVDLTGAVCPDEVCSPLQGDRWVYRDGGHISVPTARALTEPIRAALAAELDRR